MNEEKFQSKLLEWHKLNKSTFPWRRSRDPYKIFVSEILLRKTTRNQVKEIYSRFIRMYPKPLSLKNSNMRNLEKELKNIGLYKTRAKILKKAGKFIVDNLNNKIPENPLIISKIPGMGLYGTNAILCFSYGKRVPLVDTNVIRVYSRVFGTKINKSKGYLDKKLWSFAENILPKNNPADFNFALLDFANKLCKPKNPKCYSCPMPRFCHFFKSESS